jgi:hypothetical protein
MTTPNGIHLDTLSKLDRTLLLGYHFFGSPRTSTNLEFASGLHDHKENHLASLWLFTES